MKLEAVTYELSSLARNSAPLAISLRLREPPEREVDEAPRGLRRVAREQVVEQAACRRARGRVS